MKRRQLYGLQTNEKGKETRPSRVKGKDKDKKECGLWAWVCQGHALRRRLRSDGQMAHPKTCVHFLFLFLLRRDQPQFEHRCSYLLFAAQTRFHKGFIAPQLPQPGCILIVT